jgi:pilus assembly protein FimV
MAFNKNRAMEAARKYVEKGQTDRAIKEYLKVVNDDPKDVRVWLKIGDLYAKKGAKAEATETYMKVAKFYSEQGFYLKAVAVYKQILKLDPRMVEVNLKLAELYRQLGLLSDAMQHFERVAAFFHREGKTQEALATIRQLVDLDPDNVATRIKLAELYSKEEMTQEAIQEFRQACDYLRSHNRQDDFIKVAERLLWHDASDIGLNRELATLYLRRSDARRALQKLQVCFKADARDVETLALLAQAFQALKQKSKTVSVLKELARVFTENGQKQEALDVHRKILMISPDDPDSRAAVGEPPPKSPSREAVRRAASVVAEAPLQRSLRPNVTGSMPLVRAEDVGVELEYDGSSFSVADSGDFVADIAANDDSFQVGGNAVEANADEIAKILTETDVYVKYGLEQKAIAHLQKVFEIDPNNVEARERLKDIYISIDQDQAAVTELLRLVETVGSHDPDRAEVYLREAAAVAPYDQRIGKLAARYSLDLGSDSPEVEIVEPSARIEVYSGDEGTGTTAPVDDVDFDDLEFSDGLTMNPGDAPVFLTDDSELDVLGRRDSITQEVRVDQLEGEVGLDELEIDELAFDEAVNEGTKELSLNELEFESDPLDAGLDDSEDLGFRRPDSGFGSAKKSSRRGVGKRHRGDLADPMSLDAQPLDVAELDNRRFRSGIRAPAMLTPDEDDLGGLASGQNAAHYAAPETLPPDEDVLSDLNSPREAVVADDIDDEFGGDIVLADSDLTEDTDEGESIPFDDAPGPAGRGVTGTEQLIADEGGNTSLEDDLDEADFFVSQGLFEEAKDILESLLRQYPSHPLLMAKLQDVRAAEGAPGGLGKTPTPTPRPRALDRVGLTQPGGANTPSVKLARDLDDEDADTHFDLGLAYKEMGLLDEAIKAFRKVVNVAARAVESSLMIGLCYREQGALPEAIQQFKNALYVDGIAERQKLGLYYELGATYELMDDASEALYFFEMVAKKDGAHRDVVKRIAALKKGTTVNGNGVHAAKTAASAGDDVDAAFDSMFGDEDKSDAPRR